MSTIMTGSRRVLGDHFEPDDSTDPKAQRLLRGQLEQIDYTTYAANKEVLGAVLGRAEPKQLQRLALVAAQARAQWAATALAAADGGRVPSTEQLAEITRLRCAYEELTHAYDALRRMIERGYLAYGAPAAG